MQTKESFVSKEVHPGTPGRNATDLTVLSPRSRTPVSRKGKEAEKGRNSPGVSDAIRQQASLPLPPTATPPRSFIPTPKKPAQFGDEVFRSPYRAVGSIHGTPETSLRSQVSGSGSRSRAGLLQGSSPTSSTGRWLPSQRDAHTGRVVRAPDWRRNRLRLREELSHESSSLPSLSKNRVLRHASSWHATFGLACASLSHRMGRAMAAQLEKVDEAGKKNLLQMPGDEAGWKNFFNMVGNAAWNELVPDVPRSGHKPWNGNSPASWAPVLQRRVLQNIPLEVRIMLGELMDEFRRSAHYLDMVKESDGDIDKTIMNRKIIDTLIAGLRAGLNKPERSGSPQDSHSSSMQSVLRSGQRDSSLAEPEVDFELQKVFGIFLNYLETALKIAVQQKPGQKARATGSEIDARHHLGASDFTAIVLEETLRRARHRSNINEKIKIETSFEQQCFDKALSEELGELKHRSEWTPPARDAMAGSESESSIGQNRPLQRPARWHGEYFPDLHNDFVEKFDEIRIEKLVDEGCKYELRSPSEMIEFILPHHQPGQAFSDKDRHLLFSLSYLASGKIEDFVRAAYFHGNFPLKTADSHTVFPAEGTLHTVHRLQWMDGQLCLRYTLQSPDVARVTVPPEAGAMILTSQTRATESAAPFKLTGIVYIDEEGMVGFPEPRVNAMNFNILLEETEFEDSPVHFAQQSGSASKSASRFSRLGHSFRSSFRLSTNKPHFSSIEEAISPTKLLPPSGKSDAELSSE